MRQATRAIASDAPDRDRKRQRSRLRAHPGAGFSRSTREKRASMASRRTAGLRFFQRPTICGPTRRSGRSPRVWIAASCTAIGSRASSSRGSHQGPCPSVRDRAGGWHRPASRPLHHLRPDPPPGRRPGELSTRRPSQGITQRSARALETLAQSEHGGASQRGVRSREACQDRLDGLGSFSAPTRTVRSSSQWRPSGRAKTPGDFSARRSISLEARPGIELSTAARVQRSPRSVRAIVARASRDRPRSSTPPSVNAVWKRTIGSGSSASASKWLDQRRAFAEVPLAEPGRLLADVRARGLSSKGAGRRSRASRARRASRGHGPAPARWADRERASSARRRRPGPGARSGAAGPSRATRRRVGQQGDQLRGLGAGSAEAIAGDSPPSGTRL